MADSLLLRAIKGQARNVNLSFKKLGKVPRIIGTLHTLVQIDLKGNSLTTLPDEFGQLIQVNSAEILLVYVLCVDS